MKQGHTEGSVEHTDGEQNTGNHHRDGEPDAHGADRFGGTRAGAQNVEPKAAGDVGGPKAPEVNPSPPLPSDRK